MVSKLTYIYFTFTAYYGNIRFSYKSCYCFFPSEKIPCTLTLLKRIFFSLIKFPTLKGSYGTVFCHDIVRIFQNLTLREFTIEELIIFFDVDLCVNIREPTQYNNFLNDQLMQEILFVKWQISNH
jgi:hypothetical protein